MQFPVEVKIEPSKSGKTFGIAFLKGDKTIMAIKGCKLANGSNGQFATGPSTKIDDEWFNYLFIDKDFGAYVTGLAVKAMEQPAKPKPSFDNLESDIPF